MLSRWSSAPSEGAIALYLLHGSRVNPKSKWCPSREEKFNTGAVQAALCALWGAQASFHQSIKFSVAPSKLSDRHQAPRPRPAQSIFDLQSPIAAASAAMDPMSAAELLKLLNAVLDAAKKAEGDSPADRVRPGSPAASRPPRRPCSVL